MSFLFQIKPFLYWGGGGGGGYQTGTNSTLVNGRYVEIEKGIIKSTLFRTERDKAERSARELRKNVNFRLFTEHLRLRRSFEIRNT